MTREGLAALGADKLAGLVMDAAERDPAFKRLVRAALASAEGPAAVAAVIDRRLVALERARGFIDWQKQPAFARDLAATVGAIAGELAPLDAGAAAERLVRFLLGAERTFERVDDSGGRVQAVYVDQAMMVLEDLAPRLGDGDAGIGVCDRLVKGLDDDGYGLVEQALRVLIPHLADTALSHLADRIGTGGDDAPDERSTNTDAGSDWRTRYRQQKRTRVRQAIADARGDVDAFVALEVSDDPDVVDTQAVASRLLAAGRAREALDWVRRPGRPGIAMMRGHDVADGTVDHDPGACARARLEAEILDALGRAEEAQTVRWDAFAATLDAGLLREHVDRLGDFQEFDVLDRAFALAAGHEQRHRALDFFLCWPKLDRAGRLVLIHAKEWDGRSYGFLVPAAETLEEAEPLAASVLYRALLEDILVRARSSAYGHGARHLARLDRLAERIDGDEAGGAGAWGALPAHAPWRAGIGRTHSRKHGFWARVKDGAA